MRNDKPDLRLAILTGILFAAALGIGATHAVAQAPASAPAVTAEQIAQAIKDFGVEKMVNHRTITIPGYVAVLSGKLEEASSWKVSVGPREASGITAYLRAWKA